VHRASRDARRFAVAVEELSESLGADRGAKLVAEHKIPIVIGVAGEVALEQL
jgi:hypothetical protein